MRLAPLAGLLLPILLLSPVHAAEARPGQAGGKPAGTETADALPPSTKAESAPLAVTIDRAKVIRLPEGARTVIVGNPGIADVAIQKSGVVVVTGKSYGITNMIALDGTGNMLAESVVSVRAPSDAVLVVQRGPTDRQSYTCAPACLPSALLGDGTTYFNDNKAQIDRSVQSAMPK